MTEQLEFQAPATRLTALEVQGFRGWRGTGLVSLDRRLTLLVGENAAGKSSTLNAIEWCLFGSEVAKKSSGIDERADWDVVARQGAAEARVVLTLATPEGDVQLERRRARDAKARDADAFTVTLPSGDVLEGDEELDAWRTHTGMPDWNEWKHAFCQHQERSRGRVLDVAERSVQLGRLLGLEEYLEWSERWKTLKPKGLEKAASASRDELETELARVQQEPGRAVERLADQLEERGVQRLALGDELIADRSRALVAAGQALADAVDAPDELPPVEDAARVRDWAQQLPGAIAAARSGRDRQLRDDETQRDGWARALDALEPTERAWRDARDARSSFENEHGALVRLREQREQGDADLALIADEERRENALLALLGQAQEQLAGSGAADCPVCEQAAPGLGDRLRTRADSLATDASAARAARRSSVQQRIDVLREQEHKSEELAQREKGAAEARDRARTDLSAFRASSDAGAADGRALLDRLRRDIDTRRERLGALDEQLGGFRAATELLDLLMRWAAERNRAQAAIGDVTEQPAWRDLQDAIDEAAGLAVDIEVLARMTRAAQESKSTASLRAVNDSLGEHYARITGVGDDARARVRIKATASRLSYALVDVNGDDLLPVLNQAAVNALSLAVLFAQAEDRARDGRPAWLVLDDPGQNLDPAARRGLADALRALSVQLPVIVATFEGPLSSALEDAPGLRRYRLSSGARGTTLEELS